MLSLTATKLQLITVCQKISLTGKLIVAFRWSFFLFCDEKELTCTVTVDLDDIVITLPIVLVGTVTNETTGFITGNMLSHFFCSLLCDQPSTSEDKRSSMFLFSQISKTNDTKSNMPYTGSSFFPFIYNNNDNTRNVEIP